MMNHVKEQEAGDLAVLTALNDAFIRAVSTSDARWFDENVTEDFLNSNPDGSLASRKEFLTATAKPCPISNLRAEDIRIRILGDVAIIHGKTTFDDAGGRPGAGRYTDIYIRTGTRWLCTAAHVTRSSTAATRPAASRKKGILSRFFVS